MYIEQNFTKQNGTLRATFRHNILNNKEIYPKSRAILLISVGQEYHEGEKLTAAIELINRTGFKKCYIMLGDSIQRYDLCLDKNFDLYIAHDYANKSGDEWLLRNKHIYEKLNVPYSIIRWDYWLKHSLYNELRLKIEELFKTSSLFKEGFLKSASLFIDRYKKKLDDQHKSEIDHQRLLRLCLEYLKEECTIIMLLWAQEMYEFIIYPSEMLEAMKVTRDLLVKPYYPTALYWLSLRYKRKKYLIKE